VALNTITLPSFLLNHHINITEILLKVELNTIPLPPLSKHHLNISVILMWWFDKEGRVMVFNPASY
jgi:hypothetical protein